MRNVTAATKAKDRNQRRVSFADEEQAQPPRVAAPSPRVDEPIPRVDEPAPRVVDNELPPIEIDAPAFRTRGKQQRKKR